MGTVCIDMNEGVQPNYQPSQMVCFRMPQRTWKIKKRGEGVLSLLFLGSRDWRLKRLNWYVLFFLLIFLLWWYNKIPWWPALAAVFKWDLKIIGPGKKQKKQKHTQKCDTVHWGGELRCVWWVVGGDPVHCTFVNFSLVPVFKCYISCSNTHTRFLQATAAGLLWRQRWKMTLSLCMIIINV